MEKANVVVTFFVLSQSMMHEAPQLHRYKGQLFQRDPHSPYSMNMTFSSSKLDSKIVQQVSLLFSPV